MKATLWLWSLVTTLLCVSQQVAAEPYTDTRIIQPQDNSLVAPAKRTKPSLSIVNPLDVLRQRIMLEMARRQMRENTRQVERNKAILREIGKRSHGEFPKDANPLRSRREHFYYQKLPFLRLYEPSHERRLSAATAADEYEFEPSESRKSTGTGRSNNDSSKTESGNQITEHEQISSSSSSRNGNSGALTLAQEQRLLEREQQQQEAEKLFHSSAVGPQELRFAGNRVILPSGVVDDQRDDDEYFDSSNLLDEPEQQEQQQQNDKLKSDDYRLSMYSATLM